MNTIELYRKQLLKALKRKDVESFEDLENYNEDYENLRMRGGFGLPQFKTASRPYMPSIPGNPPSQSYIAQYDFKIYYKEKIGERELTEILPVPIFLPLFIETYDTILELPQSVIITGAGYTRDVEIWYQKGQDGVRLQIEGLTAPFTPLMFGILTSEEYEISKIRLSCREGKESFFFSTYLKEFGKTSLGKVYKQDTIPFISQKSPMQYVKNILDIDVKAHIQKDSGLIYGMPGLRDIGLNEAITFSLFITKLNRK